jgi:hypothetical protein
LTPEQIESYRPKAASTVPVADAIPNELQLVKLLGPASGLPIAAAQRLAHYITLLEKRIAALEKPAKADVESEENATAR